MLRGPSTNYSGCVSEIGSGTLFTGTWSQWRHCKTVDVSLRRSHGSPGRHIRWGKGPDGPTPNHVRSGKEGPRRACRHPWFHRRVVSVRTRSGLFLTPVPGVLDSERLQCTRNGGTRQGSSCPPDAPPPPEEREGDGEKEEQAELEAVHRGLLGRLRYRDTDTSSPGPSYRHSVSRNADLETLRPVLGECPYVHLGRTNVLSDHAHNVHNFVFVAHGRLGGQEEESEI